jgi:RNA polymerase sigma factor (sigma-70 family)
MSSDERLVRRAAQGDPHAFEAIYNRYHQDLYRFCLAMVGNPQDAQDALQNTMVKVLRALPGEERRLQLKPWLYRIARNESVETLRKRRDSDELDAEAEQGAVASVAETAETRARLRALIADLEELPQRQRAALVMRELAGLDFAEIGEAFETSAAVARQTLYEARLSLRQLEEGREMSCVDVMRELSDADGRVTRRREIRSHLRSCADCRAFRDGIVKRREELSAIAPLPLAASAGLLQAVIGGSAAGSAGGGAVAATVGAGAGKAVATSTIVKSAATVAVAAVAGVSAADRGGLIDLPTAGNEASQNGGKPGGAGGGDAADGGSGSPSKEVPAAKQKARGGGGRAGDGRHANSEGQDTGSQSKNGATRSEGQSKSQAGLDPPGGGHGRSASKRHGRPDGPPQAAGHGQGTAAGHKPPQAAGPSGQDGNAAANSPGSGSGAPAVKPASPPKAQTPPPPPPLEPPAESSPDAGAKTGARPAQPAQGAPPRPER